MFALRATTVAVCTVAFIMGIICLCTSLSAGAFVVGGALTMLSALHSAAALAGVVGGSQRLCCEPAGWSQLVLVLAAASFAVGAVGMSVSLASACSRVVQVSQHDWRGWLYDGRTVMFADDCSAPLPVFLATSVFAAAGALCCAQLLSPWDPSTTKAGTNARTQRLMSEGRRALFVSLGAATWAAACLVLLHTSSLQLLAAPAPPPQPAAPSTAAPASQPIAAPTAVAGHAKQVLPRVAACRPHAVVSMLAAPAAADAAATAHPPTDTALALRHQYQYQSFFE
jgi:hypothetical protein